MNTSSRGDGFIAVLKSLAIPLSGGAGPGGTRGSGSLDKMKASGPSWIDKDDLEFFENAAHAYMAEIQAAEIASTRAWAATIKSLANTVASDNRLSIADLKVLATRKGVVLPAQLDKIYQWLIDELQHVESKHFDVAYAAEILKNHKEAIDVFKTTSSYSTDAEIRAFATRKLLMLQHHLDLVQELKVKDDE